MKLAIGLATTAALLVASPALAQQAAAPQQPAAEQAQQAATEHDEELERLARHAHSARMLGILAADKNVPLEVTLLGDSIAEANAQIDLRLAELAREQGIDLPRFSAEEAQAEFAELVVLNQQEFTDAFAERINDLYPRLIESFDEATDREELAELRDDVRPRLDKHLDAARELSEDGEIGQETAEALRQEGPIERKDAPEAARRDGDDEPRQQQ